MSKDIIMLIRESDTHEVFGELGNEIQNFCINYKIVEDSEFDTMVELMKLESGNKNVE